MFRWLVENLSTLALALVLALFVWFVAVKEINPVVEQPYQEPIPVTMLYQPAGSVLTNNPDDAIGVVVRGLEQTVDALQLDDFSAVVDLSTIPLGGAEVPITVTVNDPLLSIVGQDADSIYVHLDVFRNVSLPISLTILGEPALGHIAGEPQMEPAEVILKGPASRIDPAVEARVQLDIQGAHKTVQDTVNVQLRDADGRPVIGVDPVPADVSVTVPITESDEYAELLVTVNLTGTPAVGYRLANYSAEPQKVMIFGPPEIVSELPGFINTFPVDMTNAESVSEPRVVGLQVPEGVTLVGAREVEVTIDIQPVQTTVTLPWRPTIMGPDAGLSATLSVETFNVSVKGSLALMDEFNPESDLNLSLNLYGLPVGSHEVLPAALSNLMGVEVEAVLPSTVLVEIYPVPTPTPTPTITGTVTITGTLFPSLVATPPVQGTPVFMPTATPTR